MQNRRVRRTAAVWLVVALGCWVAAPCGSHAAREAKGDAMASEGELEARRLYDKAQELLQAQENDRGVKMLESIIEQYPKSKMVLPSSLALGKHYLGAHDQGKAISYFNRIKALEATEQELTASERDLYLEALYLMGVAHFQVRQYGQAFPILRKITNNYPNTVWANQAYYYIGMCHFAQQNWNKAIDALGLVGTFVDPDSPTVQYIEAGRRFYVKVQDADLPVLVSQGKQVTVTVESGHGDRESIECIPLSAEGAFFIGSAPTEIGMAKPGDHVIQVIGGDVLNVRYVDENAQDGQAGVARESKVKVVSTAALSFTSGDYETKAAAAFLDQPLYLMLQDVDLDVSDNADSAEVMVISRYKDEDTEDTAAAAKPGDLARMLADEKKFKTRDQVKVKLTEMGTAPVHTGRFGGSVLVQSIKGDRPIDQTDPILTCALDDEIVISYVDDLHIGGDTKRDVSSTVTVLGSIDNRPKATQDVVVDAVVKSKKNLVEATAYLELARIFRSMGLMSGAKEKVSEGLDRVEFVIRSRAPIPAALKQDAFKLKWELHVVADDFTAAIATCNLFNRLYPDSPFVDQALMGIGSIRMENKEYQQAIAVFQQVLGLPKSEAKPEAQFRIAQAVEVSTKAGSEQAVQQYKLCAERYPESPFAGEALAKLVDYHVEAKDYAQANALLEQIFQDYPDAAFLDSMLLKWVLVAYRSGDFQKAYDKCSQLLFEYPESPYAEKTKQILPKIEARLKKSADKGVEQQ